MYQKIPYEFMYYMVCGLWEIIKQVFRENLAKMQEFRVKLIPGSLGNLDSGKREPAYSAYPGLRITLTDIRYSILRWVTNLLINLLYQMISGRKHKMYTIVYENCCQRIDSWATSYWAISRVSSWAVPRNLSFYRLSNCDYKRD